MMMCCCYHRYTCCKGLFLKEQPINNHSSTPRFYMFQYCLLLGLVECCAMRYFLYLCNYINNDVSMYVYSDNQIVASSSTRCCYRPRLLLPCRFSGIVDDSISLYLRAISNHECCCRFIRTYCCCCCCCCCCCYCYCYCCSLIVR